MHFTAQLFIIRSTKKMFHFPFTFTFLYGKTFLKHPLPKRPDIGFQDQLYLNAGQTYCRMLQLEHFAIHLTFIKLPFVIKIFVLSILVTVLDRFYCTCLVMQH